MANTNEFIDVPIKWILGEPVLDDESIDPIGEQWESPNANFTHEHVEGFCEKYGYNEADVKVQTYLYQEWCEVMVLKSIATGRDLLAYTCIERSEIDAGTLSALEPDLANLIVRFAFIEQLSM